MWLPFLTSSSVSTDIAPLEGSPAMILATIRALLKSSGNCDLKNQYTGGRAELNSRTFGSESKTAA